MAHEPAKAPWPQCELCRHLRPPHALRPYGAASACADEVLCDALRTRDVGPDGVQPRPGPNDEPHPEETVTPPNGVFRNGV